MLNKLLVTAFLLALSGNCFGQSDLVMYDDDGDRIGIYAFPDGPPESNSRFWVTAHDGYQFGVSSVNGTIFPLGGDVGPFYQTEDCSGQAYFQGRDNALPDRGGYLFRIIDSPANQIFF